MELVTDRNMSQFLEGSFGLLLSQEAGMPVYLRAALIPEVFWFKAVFCAS